jgi:hypothetical protein
MIERSSNWISANFNEEIVMMSLDRGTYVGLNQIGGRIWQLLETPHDVEGLCAALAAEYEINPADCRAELAPFLAELLAYGVLVETAPRPV